MKKLTLILLALAASAVFAQDTKSVPVYLKTTPNPVIVPADAPVTTTVFKRDEAPRKSKAVTKQKAKATTNSTNQATK